MNRTLVLPSSSHAVAGWCQYAYTTQLRATSLHIVVTTDGVVFLGRCFIPAHFREEYDRNCPSLKKREGSYRRARTSSAGVEEGVEEGAAATVEIPDTATSDVEQPIGEYHGVPKGESVGEYHPLSPADDDKEVVMNPTVSDGGEPMHTLPHTDSNDSDVAPKPLPRGDAAGVVGSWSEADGDAARVDPTIYVNHVPRHQTQKSEPQPQPPPVAVASAAKEPTIYKHHTPLGMGTPAAASAPKSPPPLPAGAPVEPVFGQPEAGCVNLTD